LNLIIHEEILDMDSRYRAKLINSLSGFKSANLICSINESGQTNLAIFSSVVHLGASPALIGFVMRPNTVERHTLDNIQQTGQYTINQINKTFWKPAHQTSASYAREQCEFKETGLTPQFISHISAPFVQESHCKYALKLQEVLPIKLNNTSFVIGEITDIICDADTVQADGHIDLESLDTVAISGLDSYHTTKALARLSYAKPDKLITELDLSAFSNKNDKR
jgi:flavin reductase (DIM6/NTAB) family NADH-FMN oxidoreductase RutF